MTSYEEVMEYLYSTLPMYQRQGSVAIKKDLTNTLLLCRALDNPHHRFRSIHIAGSNGKGSVAHMLAAVLQSAGLTTGLYTSPHLTSFTERIKVNGMPVPSDYVVEFVNKHKALLEKIKPSFFETTVAMAFEYFASYPVDIAVIETGLGGRLDSTNVLTPICSVITTISLEHTEILGDNLAQIAGEKAGIIKAEIPVVIGKYHEETYPVFEQVARHKNAELFPAWEKYQVEFKSYEPTGQMVQIQSLEGHMKARSLHLDLAGRYQLENVRTVFSTLEVLNQTGFSVSPAAISNGLSRVTELTEFKGRWQVLAKTPLVIADVSHNQEGIEQVLEQLLELFSPEQLIFILGFVREKKLEPILSLFPAQSTYYFCNAALPRALPAGELADLAASFGFTGKVVADVNQALKLAVKQANQQQCIFIGGSSFVVAELEGI